MIARKRFQYNGRTVEVNFTLERHTCDSYAVEGYYLDNGKDMSEAELDEVTDLYQDIILNLAFENGVYRE